jgi:hypothetical protein
MPVPASARKFAGGERSNKAKEMDTLPAGWEEKRERDMDTIVVALHVNSDKMLERRRETLTA